MAKLSRQVGTTSMIVEVFIQDTSQTGGQGLTGLTNSSSGLSFYYKRNTGSTSVAVSTINSISTLGTYAGTSTQGAFGVVDGTNMPGTYELHIPSNALTSGADSVVIYLFGATNMAPVVLEIELTATNNQDGTRGGMTSLPNANVAASGGLLTIGTGSGQINPDGTGAVPTAMGTALPSTLTSNTVGEALFFADILGGRVGTAQAGGSTSITLDSGASAGTNAYIGDDIYLYGGTGGGSRGTGQRRTITAYNTSTKVATVNRAWDTNPDSTTRFVTLPRSVANVGMWSYAVVPSPSQLGVPLTDPHYFNGTASAATAGYVGIDWSAVHAPTSTVGLTNTTISVSQTVASITGSVGGISGIIFPTNFSSLVIDTSGRVDLGRILGTASAGAAGYVGVDWSKIANPTSTVILAGTTISSSQAVANVSGSVGSISGVAFPSEFSSLTTANIATAVWTDTTFGDFATPASPGKTLVSQLGGAFTSTSSSVFTTPALANAPTGGSAPTTAEIATAVWQDLISSSDFSTAGSIGKLLASYTTPPTTSAIAAAILVAPANLLATDSSGHVTLASAGLDQIAVESGVNARQALAVIGAACAGTASGLFTNDPIYTGMNSSTNRIVASTDSNGDRTSVMLNLP